MCVGTPLNRKATPRVLGVERTVYNVGENTLNRGKAAEAALLLLVLTGPGRRRFAQNNMVEVGEVCAFCQ